MHFDGNFIVPAYEVGETEELVLIAIAMAGYELSDPIEPDDPAELFPRKGFLLPREAREFISLKPYGRQLVMHFAHERHVMLDVRPQRFADREDGREDAFVVSAVTYGGDVGKLVERANIIMFDLVRGLERALFALFRAMGHDVPDATLAGPSVPAIGTVEGLVPPPWPDDAFDHDRVIGAEELDAAFADHDLELVPDDDVIELQVEADDDEDLALHLHLHSRWVREEESEDTLPDVIWRYDGGDRVVVVELPPA